MESIKHDAVHRYALSFTSGALLIQEATVAVPVYLRHGDWTSAREEILEGNLLQARTRATALRRVREVIQRLEMLAEAELHVFADAVGGERQALLWVAACRKYAFLGEFAEEVVRERYLLLKPDLDHAVFDGFVTEKGLWHPELEDLKPSTRDKLRSSVFRMLQELGVLSREYRLQGASLSFRVAAELSRRTPSDLRFFPTQQTNRQEAAL